MSDKMTKSGFHKYFIYIFLVLVLTAVIFSLSGVFARYTKQHESGQGVVISKEMYFESDYLSEQGVKYTISGNAVTFRLMNYPDELRVSEIDVDYTVTVTGGECTLSNNSGKLSATGRNFVDITLSGLEKGKTYTVTADGENGYKKTLTATFTVKAEENNVYKSVQQNDYYVLLTVWTQKVHGAAEISFPKTLLPDNTDSVLKDVTVANTTDGQVTFTDNGSFAMDEGYSSRTYRFFVNKDDQTVYTADMFSVTVGDVPAVKESD